MKTAIRLEGLKSGGHRWLRSTGPPTSATVSFSAVGRLRFRGILGGLRSSDRPGAFANPRILGILGLFCVLGTLCGASPVSSQMAPIPFHQEPYPLASGIYGNQADSIRTEFVGRVELPGATWLRLHFEDYNLGRASSITVTSLKDGAQQRLGTEAMKQWKSSTAYFNGDAVTLQLNVARGDAGIYFRLSRASVGEVGGGIRTLCDGDDRVSSDDPRAGRLMPEGCTGWIISNGAHLTAGHCAADPGFSILEFNVPPSLSDGTVQHPGPEDQYAIDTDNVIYHHDHNIGNDWAVFSCFPNSDTGLLPVHAQGAFYRLSIDLLITQVSITGYGVDETPPGSQGGRNADSQTLQTQQGPFLERDVQGPSDVVLSYLVDTEGGNSGSPVIYDDSSVTLGIHTNGGCDPPETGNLGTGFGNQSLDEAIRTFPGPQIEYVDRDHPAPAEEGTVLRPFDTVGEGIAAATPGALVSIVAGAYPETPTISKPVTLVAPVGVVTIGQ